MATLLFSTLAHSELQFFKLGDKVFTKVEYISAIEELGIHMCEINAKDYNFPVSECRKYLMSKSDDCMSNITTTLPDYIESKSQVMGYTKNYLMCATPPPQLK